MSGQIKEVSVQYQAGSHSCDSEDSVESRLCPPGYKQTEIGVIPEDWELEKFSNIAQLKSERINPKVKGGGDFCIELEHIGQGTGSIIGSVFTTDNSSLKNVFDKDDVLFGKLRSYLRKYWLAERDGCCSTEIWVLSALKNITVPGFLFQTVQTDKFITCSSEAYGTHMPRSDWKVVKEYLVPLPSKKEQAAIAYALSDVDALITSQEKLITKKYAIKTAAMQQLLTGKKRLPPFDLIHTGYKQTELGQIPEDWEVVELGNIGKNIIGLTYSPNDVVEYGSLVLRSSNVQNNKLAFENNVFVNMDLPERVIVREGDILVCVRNGSKQLIGKCALIDKKTEGAAFGAFMSIYRTEFSSFIFYQFQSNIIQRQIDEIMGATINQITNKDMSVFKVPFPNNVDEQVAIANVLSDMDKEIDTLEQRLNKTQQLKQGMMQELLTGRTRLI